MGAIDTGCLLSTQAVCARGVHKYFVPAIVMSEVETSARWLRVTRERVGWTQADLAANVRAAAEMSGVPFPKLQQQHIGGFENLDGKKPPKSIPAWFAVAEKVLKAKLSGDLHPDVEASGDAVVMIERLPTYAGAGGGGTGEDDRQLVAFSRSIVDEIGANPNDLILIEIEGDSLAPEYLSGDKMIANRRKVSLAQPGAFCLWDGDGYVVKYLEKVPGSDPAKVRVISGNQRYSTYERLVEEITIMGRIEWFARRV